MNKFSVPEKYREEFSRALDCAVSLQSFTDITLASELGISRLNAAIFIGFMDKYAFIYPSGKNEVKTVRVTPDEWEALGHNIDAYEPRPIEEEPVFLLTPFERVTSGNRSIEKTSEGVFIVSGESSLFIPAEELTLPHFKKAGIFKKGFVFFGDTCPKNAREAEKSLSSLTFKRKQNDVFERLFANILSDLEKKV